MEWLGLQLFAELPATGQIVIDCRHEPLLIILAYIVVSAAAFATLDIAERQCHSENDNARRQWRILGACCLAGGIWALHFISMLAFHAPLETHYDAALTGLSLLLALLASWFAMHSLERHVMSPRHYLQAATFIGLGVTLMHYVGMAAMKTSAVQYYQTSLLLASLLIAIVASLLALVMARYFRNGSGTLHLAMKYGASLLMAGGIVATHFTGMAAMTLVIPADAALRLPSTDNSLQLGLTVACITLLISASSISAALADKKLQSKEHDLRRVSVLLSQLDQARMSLQQAAHYDALTNLINRRGFNQVFAERLAEHAANEGMLAVMFLDIDHFKRINDSLGHALGDELLIQMAQRIRAVLDNDLPLARYAGDEFSLLLPLGQRGDSQPLAMRLLEQLRPPFELAGQRIAMTFSLGIAHYPQDGANAGQLLRSAGLAVGHCKRSGRNRSQRFTTDLQRDADDLLSLEMDLRHALAQGGLHVAYQPIVDPGGAAVALEALVRWQHPVLGPLSPERFVRVAEETGLIAELDGWVMRQACADLAQLHREGHAELRVSVNCSALNLSDRLLPQAIARALQAEDLPASALILEVTENALMHSLNVAVEVLGEIRTLGVRVSIDDFGSGYSSLAYLSRLPVDSLKVVRAFVRTFP